MSIETRSEGSGQSPGPRSFDLRERKRTSTRLMIQTEALRLFTEKGYAQTTVEEIADAAAISPRTFFRYFPNKEDVVIWDEYDPLALDLLASLLARTRGAVTDELTLRVIGSALLAAVSVALDLWQRDGGEGDLLVALL